MTTLMPQGKTNAAGELGKLPPSSTAPQKKSEVLQYVEPCTLSCLKLAWAGLQKATGPSQLWTYCCDDSLRYCVAFISSYSNAWLEFGARSENKVLFGVIGYGVNGWIKFVQVLRIGKDVPEAKRRRAERLKRIPFQEVFNECVGEIILDPEDNRDSLRKKISQLENVDPSLIRI